MQYIMSLEDSPTTGLPITAAATATAKEELFIVLTETFRLCSKIF
jgi:hypothetical protein